MQNTGTARRPASKVSDRLMAHARLCRQLAHASLDEALGEKLLNLSEECVRAAADAIVAER